MGAVLLEREREVDAIERVLAAGGALRLAGAAGLGKTVLIELAARRAQGMTVRAVGGHEFERDVPWARASRLLADVHGRGPLAVLVDDVQWADERSLRLLRYIALRATERPLALIVAGLPDGRDWSGVETLTLA